MNQYDPVRASTGTEHKRRRLTEEEAALGILPERFTAKEWEAMHYAVVTYENKPSIFDINNDLITDSILSWTASSRKRLPAISYSTNIEHPPAD